MNRDLLFRQIIDFSLGPDEIEDISVDDLLDQLEKIDHFNIVPLKRSILISIIRTLEMQLLADRTLLNMVRMWPSFFPVMREKIRERLLVTYNYNASDDLVEHIFQRMDALRRAKNFSKNVTGNDEFLVFKEFKSTHSDLRCQGCGYHFTPSDLGESRRELVSELGLNLSDYKLPGRLEDNLKPICNRHGKSMTTLEIDHIIPRVSFGNNSSKNLQILCNFCNQGKLIYRWGGEPYAIGNAASLMHFINSDELFRAQQISVVSAILSAKGHCETCSLTVSDTELTAVCNPNQTVTPEWRAENNLIVTCYTCKEPFK